MTPPRPPSVEAVGLDKRFGELVALENVSLEIRPGRLHALLGENGAGKSTLVKCLMGYHAADRGRVLIGGHPVSLRSPRDAQALGLGMVYQHFTLVENMTVAENLVLARANLPFRIRWAEEAASLASFMERMPFRLPLDRPVRTLAAGEKQKLEILKQLHLGARVMILDEPTSVLTPGEADEVLALLRGLTRQGELSVLMISHKLREVMAYADDVTVLRRGRLAGSGEVANLTPEELTTMMMGTAAVAPAPERAAREPGEVCLRLEDLDADDDRGARALQRMTVELRAGEIVGVAGVAGNGQKELVEVLAGQRRPARGRILVRGQPYRGRRRELRDHGVRCLPEEPLRNACAPAMTVAENIALRSFDGPGFTWLRWAVRRGAIRGAGDAAVRAFAIKAPSVDAPIRTLSGGNVQRAVLARELADGLRVLIAADPCFGLDLGATAEIRRRLMEARNAGVGVLLVSSDLDEVLQLSDRVVVLSGGRVVYETDGATADRAQIGRHMAGHA